MVVYRLETLILGMPADREWAAVLDYHVSPWLPRREDYSPHQSSACVFGQLCFFDGSVGACR